MTVPDWRHAQAYAPLAGLTAPAWAWEFLRRNPAYGEDYRWFMKTWRALEADHGAPPARDFHRWRQDPRAWRMGESENLLIECWMAERWGLAGFPRDPALTAPALDTPPDWHAPPPLPTENDEARPQGNYEIDLRFDARAPLEAQLDTARRILHARRHRLRRAGRLEPAGEQARADFLTRCLRLLDAHDTGVTPEDAAMRIDTNIATQAAAMLARAQDLRAGGYRYLALS